MEKAYFERVENGNGTLGTKTIRIESRAKTIRIESRAKTIRIESRAKRLELEKRRLEKERKMDKKRLERWMEEKRLYTEIEEKRLERKLEAKLKSEKLAAQLELERLQVERARIERENIKTRAKMQSAASSQAGQENMAAMTKISGLPSYADEKDNLDNYLLRLERYPTIAGWQRDTWVVRFSPLLTGKALDVYPGLSSKDARDYDKLRKALL